MAETLSETDRQIVMQALDTADDIATREQNEHHRKGLYNDYNGTYADLLKRFEQHEKVVLK